MSSLGFNSRGGSKMIASGGAAQRAQQRAQEAMNGNGVSNNPATQMYQRMQEMREQKAMEEAQQAQMMLETVKAQLNGTYSQTPQALAEAKRLAKDQASMASVTGKPSGRIQRPQGTSVNKTFMERKPPTKAQEMNMQQQQMWQQQQQMQMNPSLPGTGRSDFQGFSKSAPNTMNRRGPMVDPAQQRQMLMLLQQQQQQMHQQKAVNFEEEPEEYYEEEMEPEQEEERPQLSITERIKSAKSLDTSLEKRVKKLEVDNDELVAKIASLLEEKSTDQLKSLVDIIQIQETKIQELENSIKMIQEQSVDGATRELYKKVNTFDSQLKIKFNEISKRDTAIGAQINSVITDVKETKQQIAGVKSELEEKMETVFQESQVVWGTLAHNTCLYPEIPTYEKQVEPDQAEEAGAQVMLVGGVVTNDQSGQWQKVRVIDSEKQVSTRWVPYFATMRWLTADENEDDTTDIRVFKDLSTLPYLLMDPPQTNSKPLLYDNSKDK